MKRGVYGTYHQISYKHLHRYCDEYSYRYNSRILHDNERLNITLNRTEGRLKYSQLISNEREKAERER